MHTYKHQGVASLSRAYAPTMFVTVSLYVGLKGFDDIAGILFSLKFNIWKKIIIYKIYIFLQQLIFFIQLHYTSNMQ